MIETQIPNYKITHERSSGSMGAVYEAVHVKFDTKIGINS